MNEKSQEASINDNSARRAINKENIQLLLEALKIATAAADINIVEEIALNPVNESIIIEIKSGSRIGENKILLDIKDGLPMVDQIYNAIYKLGANCQKRIIAFQDGICWDDKENPGADVGKVTALVEAMNQYDQGIYLVKITNDSTDSGLEYKIIHEPDDHPKFNKEECPTAVQFTEAEIWQIHFWPKDHFFQELRFQAEFDPNREYGLNFEVGGIGIDTKWKNEDAQILVTDNNTKGNKLERIWKTAKDEIMEMFRGCDIELLFRFGRIEKLTITVFDKPIDELTGTPWREKMHFAGLLWTKYMQFERFIERLFQDCKLVGE